MSNFVCSVDSCPVILSAVCVIYQGDNLIYTGINDGDNLQTALQKIDAAFADAGLGYAFQNGVVQTTPGVPVELGGSLLRDTTIAGNYKLTLAGRIEAARHITTGGTVSQFVKGDGTLDSNAYQLAGNYITALTGDGTAIGPGSAALTLATVNANPGTYGTSTLIPRITVDAKGRVTSITTTAIPNVSNILVFEGDVTGSGTTGAPVTLTLATVNTNVYNSLTFLKLKVNAKGLVTGASPVTNLDIEGALGYVPVPNTRTITINGVTQSLQADRSWTLPVGVASVTASAPLASTGGANPNISITKADASTNGYLSSTDWNTFNTKVPSSRTITINGTTYDLSADRTWTINSMVYPEAGIAVSTGTAWSTSIVDNSANWNTAYTERISSSSSPLSILNHVISIAQATGAADGYLSSTDWNTFNNKQPAGSYVTTSRTISTTGPLQGGGDLSADRTLSITQAGASTDGYLSSTDWTTFNSKQGSGDYITALTGEATATGPGSATVTLSTPAVTGKLLTGVNITGGSVVATDTILEAFGKVQNQINGLIGGSIYKGVWNASTNTPALASGVGTTGWYYIVNVPGTTNLDGITDWHLGDWAIFDGTAWQQVDNTDAVVSVNGYTGAVSLVSSDVPEGLTNLYYTPARARTAISLTTTGTSGAATYDNITGVLNVPVYSPDLSGYVPSTRTLTINGTGYDLSADRSWTVSGTMPAGGTAGQILAKINSTDYNTQWIDNFSSQVKNVVKLGAALTKGTPVYVSGADGTNMIVSASSNTTEGGSSKTFGLLETGGALNAQVECVTYGLIAGLDTSAAGAAGDPVWLGPNGTLLYGLANKPVAPAHMVYIGVVTRKQQNNGEIFVNIQNGFEIEELHDVLVTAPKTDGQGLFLQTIAGTQLWRNRSIPDVLGYTPANDADVVKLTGTQYIAGNKYFTGFGLFDNTIFIKQDSSVSFFAGYNSIDSDSTGIIFSLPAGNMAKFVLTSLTASRDYTLPNASGTIALTSDITPYTLPIATASVLGGIKVGSNLSINATTGVLDATYSYTLPTASTTVLGGVKVDGSTITINATTGVISGTASYSLPIATASVLGGVKIGAGVSVDAGGIISVSTSYVPLAGGTMSGILYSTYNTATGRPNLGFNTAKTVIGSYHIQNGAGPGNDNANQAAITFQGGTSSEAQAGIYVLNNNSYGTSMGFATTNSYATGPQLFMTATNGGVVDFPRARPTYAGNVILDAANYSSYALPLTGGTLTGKLQINANWGGTNPERFTIRGTYPSITLRSTNSDNNWLMHNEGNLAFYYAAGVDSDAWSRRLTLDTNGTLTTGLLIAQGPGGNYNENIRLPGSTAVISFNTSGTTGAGSYNIVSQTNFQIRSSTGAQVFVMDQSGNLTMTGTVTAPTFSGNATSATNATNLLGQGVIQRTSSGEAYSSMIQVRETSGASGNTNIIYAPALGFHWGGVVASSIRMNAGGEIQIVNNPGTSYENFRAATITANYLTAPYYGGGPTGSTYGSIRVDGAVGGYAGIFLSGASGVVTGMYDTGGNGGNWDPTTGWHFYWHRGNTCLGLGGSTTSSAYKVYANGNMYASGNIVSGGLIRISANTNLYLDHNFGCSIVGVYSSFRYQGVFSMGDAYKLAIDGTTPGNLYGLSWSHPNAGGQAGFLNDHGLLVMVNGVTYSALSSNIWARGRVTANEDVYSNNGWFYSNNNAGWYNNTYGQGLRQAKGNVTYGSVINVGENFNGWGGYNITNNYLTCFMQNSSGTHGFYQEGGGDGWTAFYNFGNKCWGLGTDATDPSYSLHIIKYGGSNTGWIIWSDRRIKENIKTIDNALDKVLSLRGVYYNKIDDPNKERCVGYIAQEVMEVVPELVVYSEELDMYNMNYGPMVGMLTEAVKEHHAKTVAQQAEIDTLKEQVQTLLNYINNGI